MVGLLRKPAAVDTQKQKSSPKQAGLPGAGFGQEKGRAGQGLIARLGQIRNETSQTEKS